MTCLPATVDKDVLYNLSFSSVKEELIKRIQSKVQHPAASLCGSHIDLPLQRDVMEQIVGVVALMGTACPELSRSSIFCLYSIKSYCSSIVL